MSGVCLSRQSTSSDTQACALKLSPPCAAVSSGYLRGPEAITAISHTCFIFQQVLTMQIFFKWLFDAKKMAQNNCVHVKHILLNKFVIDPNVKQISLCKPL